MSVSILKKPNATCPWLNDWKASGMVPPGAVLRSAFYVEIVVVQYTITQYQHDMPFILRLAFYDKGLT